ncbi:hypothetical protein DFH06DRAFT_1446584 [Mycena polygramma]|nr:hypothetical protein DFH06DRAFT_1446584 [Mycena polygramma]
MLAELEADRARVADIQAQIQAPRVTIKRTLPDLQIEQSKAQERLDSYRYPILTVPTEIISEIFMHILPSYPRFPPLTGPSSPTILAQICRQWRAISLDLSSLWSFISLDGSETGRECRMVRLWLERSRSCPLDIRLGRNINWANDALVEGVVSHRARWESLKVELGTVVAQALRIFDGPMPLLRHFEMLVDDDLPDALAFNEVPLLRSVVLNDLAVRQIILPWTQLTSLTLLRVYPAECVPVLVQTHNLLHCRLVVCFDGTGRDAKPRPDITLPSLESLALRNYNIVMPVTDLLPSFIVPALRILEIPESYLGPNPVGSLTAFVSESGCRLEELRLTGTVSVPVSVPVRSYREALPSLRLISFDDVGAYDGENSEAPDSSDD